MKANFSQMALLTMAGIQVIIIICLFALNNRVGKLEGQHTIPTEQK